MVNLNFNFGPALVFLLLPLFLQFHLGKSELQLNFYNESCPNAEKIIYEQVFNLYEKHGNVAVSFLRLLFHDCFVGGCDASILLDATRSMKSEKTAPKSFGMRNFKHINTIKDALEKECPHTVSCADIVALSARAAVILLKGPTIQEMKTGRRDSNRSYESMVDEYMPSINDSMSSVLSAFNTTGVDTEGTVALLGAHSVGRIHCKNIVARLYPEVDSTLNSTFVNYLKHRCPSLDLDPKAVVYVRNDPVTPMELDNMYYNNILNHKGLLGVDEELASDNRTRPVVMKMAGDNEYFHQQFARAVLILSEYNTLTGNEEGQIRKDCRHVN